MTRQATNFDEFRPNVLIIGIYSPYTITADINAYFQEFEKLVQSAGVEYKDALYIKLREVDPATFLTKGKLEEVAKLCQEEAIDQVIISEPLTPQQERNLRDYLHCAVFDRTRLILEIFDQNAQSAEGKMQVKIALLHFQKSRLAGKGIHLSQQTGALGVRGGFGETAKEKEKRHIEKEILKLKEHLNKLSKIRQTQRKKRLEGGQLRVSLIGYTNAGKSTILNALTKSSVLAEDRLFATLDTTTRQLILNGVKKGTIADTVGFIQQLPHTLIEAFKSTLSELTYAHVLVQVIDLADHNWEQHIRVVKEILEELDLLDKPMVYVFNKIDLIDDLTPALMERVKRYQPYVLVSATQPNGLDPLIQFLDRL